MIFTMCYSDLKNSWKFIGKYVLVIILLIFIIHYWWYTSSSFIVKVAIRRAALNFFEQKMCTNKLTVGLCCNHTRHGQVIKSIVRKARGKINFVSRSLTIDRTILLPNCFNYCKITRGLSGTLLHLKPSRVYLLSIMQKPYHALQSSI